MLARGSKSRASTASGITSGITGNHYLYDAKGNLTEDKHKGFVITYNYLNLPVTMTKGSTIITIQYTADGEKLGKTVTSASTRNYVAGIEYLGATVEAIYHSEGRLTWNSTTSLFEYEYALKDHLGNARVFFKANGSTATPLQENHYYPFGMEMEGSWITQSGPENEHQYNGKELNEDAGLNWYDYGARWYDAAVGRWWSVDPMAEKYAPATTYGYCLNSPIITIDPDGMNTVVVTEDGTILYTAEDNLENAIIVISSDKASDFFASIINSCGESCSDDDRDWNGISGDARMFEGDTYLVDGARKVFEASLKDKADQSTTSDLEKVRDQFGNVLKNLPPEYGSSIRMNSKSQFYVDPNQIEKSEDVGFSNHTDLGFGTFHTHSAEGTKAYKYPNERSMRTKVVWPVIVGGHNEPSDWDWDHSNPKFRNIIIDSQYIILFRKFPNENGSYSEELIRVPMSYFKNKK